MSVTEDKSSDNNIVKKQGLEDMTTTESDSSLDSDHSLDQFDLHHQLDEDCQMIDEEINYPSYPVHFYWIYPSYPVHIYWIYPSYPVHFYWIYLSYPVILYYGKKIFTHDGKPFPLPPI